MRTLTDKQREGGFKALQISHRSFVFTLAVVVSKHLLIDVTLKMRGFHSNVGSPEGPLKQTPEVFDAVGVNLPIDVGLHVVHKRHE